MSRTVCVARVVFKTGAASSSPAVIVDSWARSSWQQAAALGHRTVASNSGNLYLDIHRCAQAERTALQDSPDALWWAWTAPSRATSGRTSARAPPTRRCWPSCWAGRRRCGRTFTSQVRSLQREWIQNPQNILQHMHDISTTSQVQGASRKRAVHPSRFGQLCW